MFGSVYLLNLFCSVVPCTGRQPPPEAFIREYSSTTESFRFLLPNNSYYVPSSSSQPRQGQQEDPTALAFRISPDEIENGFRKKRRYSSSEPDNDEGRSNRVWDVQSQGDFSYGTNEYESSDIQSGGAHPIFRITNNRDANLQSHSGRLGTKLSSVFPNLFSAVPVIPVLLNNLDGMMRTVSSNMRDLGNGVTVRSGIRTGKSYGVSPVARTQSGIVEGFFMGTMQGRKIAAFEGIPYAEPPLGGLRFKPPVPKAPWPNVWKATSPGSNCVQSHPLDFFRITGNEDCLYLNVYTLNDALRKQRAPLKVVFLIHGGSFQYGSGYEYGPAYLADEDVILVTFNYRLGPLGFLSTGDLVSPGNYGLKDQALALKWVYENIAYFGGDKTKITIMGQSAGGVSAHLHLTSNKTTEYFQSGVSLSGSAFGFWPIVGRRRMRYFTKKLANALNCPLASHDLINCLRGISADWIIGAQQRIYDWIPFHPLVMFAPTIEFESPDAFLTHRPEVAYERNEVMPKPWIFGQTSQEGHFDIYFMKLMMQTLAIALNGRKYLPKILDYEFFTYNPTTRRITNKVLNFYGGSLIGNGVDINAISDMYTDRYYTSTIQKAINAHSRVAPTYAYVFDFLGKYNLGSLFGVQPNEWGVAHTEDMFYFFNSSVFHHGLQQNDVEYGLSKILVNMLARFVETGIPNHEDAANNAHQLWERVHVDKPIQYLHIKKEIRMVSDPFKSRVAFWDLMKNYIPEN